MVSNHKLTHPELFKNSVLSFKEKVCVRSKRQGPYNIWVYDLVKCISALEVIYFILSSLEKSRKTGENISNKFIGIL